MLTLEEYRKNARANRLARDFQIECIQAWGLVLPLPDSWNAETDEVIHLALRKLPSLGLVNDTRPGVNGWTYRRN